MLDEEKNESMTPMVDAGRSAKTHPETPLRSRFTSFVKKTIANTISLFTAICFVILVICGVGEIFHKFYLYLYGCNTPIHTRECWDGAIKADSYGITVGLILSIPFAVKLGKYVYKKIMILLGGENDLS